MHVRIAWEIYNHQQKQKGGDIKKPGDSNPLVPSSTAVASTASSLSSSKASLSKSDNPVLAGQKRPASGAPPSTDFMHKRPATDADLLRNQLFAPPRPPPNPLDPLSNPLLPRPPYMPPFGPSPLRKSPAFVIKI